MITVYALQKDNTLEGVSLTAGQALPEKTVWIDLFQPTKVEENWIENVLGEGKEIPTRDEMQELELSNRLYVENGHITMTATVISHSDTDHPHSVPVTFVMTDTQLITIRYDELRAIDLAVTRLKKDKNHLSSNKILLAIIEAVINRGADILEQIALEIDHLSHAIFHDKSHKMPQKTPDLQHTLIRIGRKGDLISKIHESMISIGRVISYYTLVNEGISEEKSLRSALKTLLRDQAALADHATFLSGKTSFLLDATLGMITNAQNGIIKIFSVAAVIFLPPTLVASIYGMNFNRMPELGWSYGYPMALGIMVLSAILPYLYFKKKGWL